MSSSRIYLCKEYIRIAAALGQGFLVVSLPAASLDDSEVGQSGIEYKERKPRLEK